MVGATGIGKTQLAIGLATLLETDIISCDSRQFFGEMKIGTAAPSEEELSAVQHHFIGHLEVTDAYSIGKYEADAIPKINEIFKSKDIAILVGGSMMYEKAVIEGLNELPEANEHHQEKLVEIWKHEGLEKIQELLHKLDPEYFNVVDQANPRRLLRAVDVIWQSGRKYSEIISSRKPARSFDVVRIGVGAPREIIYARINQRVDAMLEKGLLQEAGHLKNFRNLVPLQTVGYTELFRYMDGEFTYEQAVEEIKKNTRRFAKRQLTWYRKERNIHWVDHQTAFLDSVSLLQQHNIISR